MDRLGKEESASEPVNTSLCTAVVNMAQVAQDFTLKVDFAQRG